MAKIGTLILPPEQEELYFRSLKQADRFTYSRVVVKQLFFGRKRRKGMSQKSLLPQITEMWNPLSQEIKDDWSEAADYSNMNGFRLFVQDTSKRIINDIEGVATPSNFHQANIGAIRIEEPATEIALIQIHPSSYYKISKIRGTKSQYEPVKVTEFLSLPVTLNLNYKSDLTQAGDNPVATIFLEIISSYQGEDRIQAAQIDFDLQSEWKNVSVELTTMQGYFISYIAKIYIFDLQGELLFDNVSIEHNANNWARDPRCNSIDSTFTKAFYQIPRHWAPITLPYGSNYSSIYPED